MYQLFNVYLQNKIVYNLVFKVLNYNFNNEEKTTQFLTTLSDCLRDNKDFETLRIFLKHNNLLFTSEKERVDLKVNDLISFFDFKNTNSILDLGCGNGHVLNSLSEKLNIKNCYGIDTVNYIKDITFNYLQYDNNKIPLNNKSIDVAISLMVLHHTKNPVHYIKELHRVLKTGGSLIIRETDAYNLDLLHFNLLMEFIFYEIIFNIPVQITRNYFSRNYFSRNEWKSLFLNNGFKLIKEKSQNVKENPFTPFYFLLEKV